MIRITEVVKHLLIINIILFIVFYGFMQEEYWRMTFLYFPRFEGFMEFASYNHFQPYQLVSHMFMHGSESHLVFNMMSLFFLGPSVEAATGPKRFLGLYLASGFAASALHLLLAYLGAINSVPIVGASGAIMGVTVAFGVMFPEKELMLMFIPVPIKAKYLVFGLIAMDLFFGIGSFDTGIAHFAHLGGALCGFLLTWYWYRK